MHFGSFGMRRLKQTTPSLTKVHGREMVSDTVNGS